MILAFPNDDLFFLPVLRFHISGHNYFEINEETGEVTVVTDYMQPITVYLEVQAYDLGTPRMFSNWTSFQVKLTDTNNEAPRFTHPEDGGYIYLDEVGYIQGCGSLFRRFVIPKVR